MNLLSAFPLSTMNLAGLGRACEVISREFGLEWIELRGMWNKNILKLDANEVTEARRILGNTSSAVTDIASPLSKVDWPGAPEIKIYPKGRINADFLGSQGEVLDRSALWRKAFRTDRRPVASISGASKSQTYRADQFQIMGG